MPVELTYELQAHRMPLPNGGDAPLVIVIRYPAIVEEFRAQGQREAGTHARVWCNDEQRNSLLEFLRAHFDAFLDAGFPWCSWFLNDCPVCGADTFEPCMNMQKRRHVPSTLQKPQKRNRTIHRGRGC